MGDAHGRIGGIDGLAAGTGGAEGVDADVFGVDLDLDFVGFGQYGDRDGGGMNAALLFGHGHALHAVHSALVFQLAVDLVAADQCDHFLHPAHGGLAHAGDFHLPALRFGVTGVHPEDLGREQRGLVAAGTGADFEDDVLCVVGVLGPQQILQLQLEAGQLGIEAGDFIGGHGAQLLVGLGEHGAGALEVLAGALPVAVLRDHLLELEVGFGGLAVAVRVVDDGGVGHLAREVFVARLELVQLVQVFHAEVRPPPAFRPVPFRAPWRLPGPGWRPRSGRRRGAWW